MSKEKRRVPKLRFPGFTEDWEQRKFSDITYLSGIKNKENKPYESYSISNEFGFIPQDEQFENGGTMKTADKSMYYIVSQNSFAYNPARINVGSIGYYNKPDNVIVSSLYEVFKTTDIVSDKFLWHWFKSNQFNRLIEKYQEGGVRLYFYYDKLCKGTIDLPTINEQNKISNLLDDLDMYITLHQRKLDNLKLKKKALLQKLFPKNGERYPELRFPGFTDAWEQRKLSDISTKVTTKNVDVHYTETLTNSAEQGIISQVDFFDKEISNKDNINGYYIVENHDFIYNPRISTLAPVGPINRNKLNRTGIMSPLYTVFRASKVDLGFLEWYFQSNHWHRYMKLNGDSGARADRIAIKDSTFFDMPIKTPVNIKEQVLIGETLEKFNQYITLHQRKLDHLQLQKKALLQQMFV